MSEVVYSFVPAQINGSVSRGGWQATGSFFNDQANVEFGQHMEIYLKIYGGGSFLEDNQLALSGSVIPNTLTWDKKSSSLDVLVSTTDYFLSRAGLQGIYFTEQAVPTNPHQITNLNLGKIVYHIVTEHTNVADTTPGGWVDVTNIDRVNSTSVTVFTVKRSNSIWTAIQDIANNEFYVRYFDKTDKLIYKPHPQFAVVSPSSVLNLNQNNIIGKPTITYRNVVKIDQAELFGLSDDGTIYIAKYPASIGTEGQKQQWSNLRVNSQARLNLLAERAFKEYNRDIDLRLSIPGPYGIFLELYDRITVTYAGTSANGVTINWTDKTFYITDITISNVNDRNSATELNLVEEVL